MSNPPSTDNQPDQEIERLTQLLTQTIAELVKILDALETVQRYSHPGNYGAFADQLDALRASLAPHRESFDAAHWADNMVPLTAQLSSALDSVEQIFERCAQALEDDDGYLRWVGALRRRTRALEALYPVASVFNLVNQLYLAPAARTDKALMNKLQTSMRDGSSDPPVGVVHAANERDARGGFSLYVPEYYDPEVSWPLLVALHGGSGHGADFLWSWLADARSRGCIVLAPTSRDRTWSLLGPDHDLDNLYRMLEFVQSQWRIDDKRILLSGMSDGATYATLIGLNEDSPFTALAPMCGVFHPNNFVNGNMARLPNRRIFQVHGALDWMFPVEQARETSAQLKHAGANIEYLEIPDLSHTYPRDANLPALSWFAPETQPASPA